MFDAKKKENSIRIYDNNFHLREDHKEFLKKKKKSFVSFFLNI